MGVVIDVWAYGEWGATYFVQTTDESEALEKAFKMAKQSFSCSIPDTLEEFQKSKNMGIKMVARIDQIIL